MLGIVETDKIIKNFSRTFYRDEVTLMENNTASNINIDQRSVSKKWCKDGITLIDNGPND
jgi:hypothetical protein